MFRHLPIFGLLILSAGPALAQSETPDVVVLRDTDKDFTRVDASNDQAVILAGDGNKLHEITGLGLIESLSCQNQVLIDTIRKRILIVEKLRDQVSAFRFDASPQSTFAIEDVMNIVLSGETDLIGCVTGANLDHLEMAFLDETTGEESHRIDWGGVAVINDAVGSQLWSVGRKLTAFTPEGEVQVRRPLSRLPAETDHPTVINARNWCGVGLAIEANENAWMRRIWVVERNHSDVRGSRNRLFAVEPDGQTRILVELEDIIPRSIAIATYRTDLQKVLIVDRTTGDLVSYNTDGELMGRESLGAHLVAFGEEAGLWVVGPKTARRLDPEDLSVIAEYVFEQEADPIGLTVR